MKRKSTAHSAHRSNEIAREKLANIMMLEVHDPQLAFVTITGCKVSPDRSQCIAYVTCDSESYEEVERALERAHGRIRSLLGRALGWYYTPRLIFRIDPSTDAAERIAQALKNVPPTVSVQKDEFGYPVKASVDLSGEIPHDEEDEA